MGADYLLKKIDRCVSIEVTCYRHIPHVFGIADIGNHIYTKSCPRFGAS